MLRAFIALVCVLNGTSVASASDPSVPARAESVPPVRADPDPGPSATAFLRFLPFFYDLYTFRGEAGATTVVAAFAVPAGMLEEERDAGRVRYRFDVSLVLADTALGSVSRTDDSVFVGVPSSLSGEHLLHTHIEVQAPPSGSTLQRVIMTDATTPGIGQLYGTPFPIPDYRGDHLMLSDVALGYPDAATGWRRRDVTLALLPTSQFPQSSFDVYYEIYNLPEGNRYSTEIAIERLDEDEGERERVPGSSAVHTRFSGESAAGEDRTLEELRRVEASLRRGSYRLTVTVTDEVSGQRATRTRLLEVRGWRRGATMVPALQRNGTPPPIA